MTLFHPIYSSWHNSESREGQTGLLYCLPVQNQSSSQTCQKQAEPDGSSEPDSLYNCKHTVTCVFFFFTQPARVDFSIALNYWLGNFFLINRGKNTQDKFRENGWAEISSYFITFVFKVAITYFSNESQWSRKHPNAIPFPPKWLHPFCWTVICLLDDLLMLKNLNRSAVNEGGAYFQARKSKQKVEISQIDCIEICSITVF